MKIVISCLLVIGMFTVGAQAQAAIDSDNALNPFTGTGAGELFLSVIDRGGTVQRSYVRDLGITAADFLANDLSYVNTISFAADANLLEMLNNVSGTIAWNIAAAYNTYDPVDFSDNGYLSTSPVTLSNANIPYGAAELFNAYTNIGIYLQAVNGSDTNITLNNSQIFASATNAYHDTFWGNLWDGAHATEGALDQSLGFYYVMLEDALHDISGVQAMLGDWTLTSNGALIYANDIGAPVPLPAAAWLLGSALMGMVFVGAAQRRGSWNTIRVGTAC